MKIDAHHHFWKYSESEYGWITDAMARIRRDFLPEHLVAEMRHAGIDGAVSVQARQTLAETRWLLEFAELNPFIRGVVGWVPLTDAAVGDLLGELVANRALRGVRHVLQGEPSDYMARADFNRGLDCLAPMGLTYDLLVLEHQLPEAIALADRHPDLPMILDHVAKPRIRDGEIEPWAQRIRELARRPHITCKLSGMVTEANLQSWTADDLFPYFQVVLEAFGPKRLMFGTDWPVCLLASSYRRWSETVTDWISPLSPAERADITGGTAMRTYTL